MVQKSRERGRPPEFDRDTVIDQTVRLFWEQGYERTSLQDLEGRTGLNRSSLYNSFGSKEALFSLALDRYLNEVATRMLVPLERGTGGIGDLIAFVDSLEEWFTSPASSAGCLMVNSMVEFRGVDEGITREACRYTERFRDAASAAFRRAVARGEVLEGDAAPRVDLLLGMILALNVAARSGVPHLTEQLIDAVRAQVTVWSESEIGQGRRG